MTKISSFEIVSLPSAIASLLPPYTFILHRPLTLGDQEEERVISKAIIYVFFLKLCFGKFVLEHILYIFLKISF